MYAELRIELDPSVQISYQQSSNLQGVIMEQIDTEYAQKLHESKLNPYSQYLLKENGKINWYIKTTSEEAYEKIILPMSKLREITVKKKEMTIPVCSRNIEITDEKTWLTEFYEKKCSGYLELNFLTPTAFKKDGRYVFYPDLELIYSSLMRKYTQASQDFEMFDSDTLESLTEQSEIIRYRLQTVPFPLEKVRITGFTGSVCIRIRGAETMARYVRMLMRAGEYTGIGIKTGIGMGAVRYKDS